MLHVLDVPKGARFMVSSVVGGQLAPAPGKVISLYSYSSRMALLFPYPGAPIAFSSRYDPGFLQNGETYGNLKDVEHLNFTGTIMSKYAFDATSPKNPGSSWASPTHKTWFRTHVKEASGAESDSWFTNFLPYLASEGITNDIVASSSINEAMYPWKASAGAYWPMTHLLCHYWSCVRTDQTTSYSLNYKCWKFSDDFSKFISWTGQTTLPGSYRRESWDTLSEVIRDIVIGDSMLRVPSTLSSAASYQFWKTIGPLTYNLPEINLDRTEVFSGELNPVWGDLAYDCYSQIQLWDGNGLAYGRDLTLITRAIRDLVLSAKALFLSKNPVQALKTLADLFLSFRYGWSLTCKDTLDLLAMDYDRAYPLGRCKRSSSYTYYRNGYAIEARMSVYCLPYSKSVSELAGFLQMIDLEITAENIWDLIPYSFVVDWVVNVGDILDRLDMIAQLDRFNILLSGQTLKVSAPVDVSKIGRIPDMVGTVDATYYKRNYTTDTIPPSLISSRDSNQKFNHWLEGSALAIQRVR
jgi:hypothetical protein